jgi:hypothetical protein
MHASTVSVAPERPILMRALIRSWEYRHPRIWVRVRVACALFNLVPGVLLPASIPWLGQLAWLAALPLAGSALIFWTVRGLRQSVPN